MALNTNGFVLMQSQLSAYGVRRRSVHFTTCCEQTSCEFNHELARDMRLSGANNKQHPD